MKARLDSTATIRLSGALHSVGGPVNEAGVSLAGDAAPDSLNMFRMVKNKPADATARTNNTVAGANTAAGAESNIRGSLDDGKAAVPAVGASAGLFTKVTCYRNLD